MVTDRQLKSAGVGVYTFAFGRSTMNTLEGDIAGYIEDNEMGDIYSG